MKAVFATCLILTLLSPLSIGAQGDEMPEEKEFPEIHWDEMKTAMESGGTDAVVEFINGFEDEERRKLYSFAQRAFYGNEWEGKSFDGYVEIVNAGIAEGLRQSEAAADPDEAARLKDFANVLSYNLSADLAECWPGDETPREKRHFEAGLKAAEECVHWREELGKGPFPFSIAYWAKGMHELSLGDKENALADFKKSFDYAVEYEKAEGVSSEISPEGNFVVILGAGYVGLAEWALGDEAGKTRYEDAIAAFEAQVNNYPEKKDDAQFGIDQLEWVKGKFIK